MANGKTGRIDNYDPAILPTVIKLCMLGCNNKQLAAFFDISERNFTEWISRHDDLRIIIQKGRDEADAKVAESLYKRAIGYEHPEDHFNVVDKELVITPSVKHYPPDTAAAIHWLKNRHPDKWRDKIDHEHSGPGGEAIPHTVEVKIVKPRSD